VWIFLLGRRERERGAAAAAAAAQTAGRRQLFPFLARRPPTPLPAPLSPPPSCSSTGWRLRDGKTPDIASFWPRAALRRVRLRSSIARARAIEAGRWGLAGGGSQRRRERAGRGRERRAPSVSAQIRVPFSGGAGSMRPGRGARASTRSWRSRGRAGPQHVELFGARANAKDDGAALSLVSSRLVSSRLVSSRLVSSLREDRLRSPEESWLRGARGRMRERYECGETGWSVCGGRRGGAREACLSCCASERAPSPSRPRRRALCKTRRRPRKPKAKTARKSTPK